MENLVGTFPSGISKPAIKLIRELGLQGLSVGAPAIYDDTDYPGETSSRSTDEDQHPPDELEADIPDYKLRLVWESDDDDETKPHRRTSAVFTVH